MNILNHFKSLVLKGLLAQKELSLLCKRMVVALVLAASPSATVKRLESFQWIVYP